MEDIKKEIRSTTAAPALGMASIPNSKLSGMTGKKLIFYKKIEKAV